MKLLCQAMEGRNFGPTFPHKYRAFRFQKPSTSLGAGLTSGGMPDAHEAPRTRNRTRTALETSAVRLRHVTIGRGGVRDETSIGAGRLAGRGGAKDETSIGAGRLAGKGGARDETSIGAGRWGCRGETSGLLSQGGIRREGRKASLAASKADRMEYSV